MMTEGKQGVALYYVIKEKLLEKIKSGGMRVGDQLPTENELTQQFQVSRTTIRLAMQQLELEGYVRKVQGKGTFVSKPKLKESLTPSIKSFQEQMNGLGVKSHAKVLEQGVVPADMTLAEKLKIELKDPVVKLVRLRYADSEPLQYSTSFIPWKLAPGLTEDDCTGSLFELLRTKYHIALQRSIESIEPILQSKHTAGLLEVKPGSPAFLLESITFAEDDRPIEYSSAVVRGDLTKFTLERFFNKEEKNEG
jgi:GntR family transcriptional regulator